jgi:N-methylhydantoinase A
VSDALTIGVDTGGTFTDLIACDSDGVLRQATKVSTTPSDPSAGILNALHSLPAGPRGAFLHGTTTGTNALLERRGARTALLVTVGFRDLLELARQNRPNLYDWFEKKAQPFVSRELSFEIEERLSPHESVRRPLDEDQVRSVIGALRDQSVESIAVCLLHAYEDGEHERAIRRLVDAELPDVHVSLSSDVLPDIMEYERASTTVANAYIAPVMEKYLRRLVQVLTAEGITRPIYVMQSNGGLGSAHTIANRAVQTVLSGPAAGVIGGLASTTGSDKTDFLTIDMGGTSFDIAYSERREATVSRESSIDGHPIAIPSLDIHTLGAGGGSIAWVDSGGALRVGPESAGSEPGPACYGRGGERPTVTDANLALGRLSGDLLGGRLQLDESAALRAIERHIARPLNLSVVEAARGMIDVVNASMAKGMHLMSVARGRDPRRLGIVGFGGAGPLHACELAAAIGCGEVVIPALPGNTSAIGLVLAHVRRERSEAVLAPLGTFGDRAARAVVKRLADRVVADLAEDGVPHGAVTLQATARVSYDGQRYQLDIPFSTGGSWEAGAPFAGALDVVEQTFRTRHLSIYGYARNEPLTLFALVVVGVGRIGSSHAPVVALEDREPGDAKTGESRRPVWFTDDFYPTRVLQRRELEPGQTFEGGAIIEQSDATTVLPPDWSGRVDPYGNLLLRRSA